MAVGDVLRTRRGRNLAFATVAGLTLILTRNLAAKPPPDFLGPGQPFSPSRYPPGTAKQIALFRRAAQAAGLPVSWSASPELVKLLRGESNGWVGIPNYQYGERAFDRSRWPEVWSEIRSGICPKRMPGVQGRFTCATGLGQLTPSNVDAFYPSGRAGIGDPLEEAIGMLRYVEHRYGSPEAAWAFWQEHRWY